MSVASTGRWPSHPPRTTSADRVTVVSQSVPHLHVHVVPRTKGDGLRGFFWPRTRYAPGEQSAYAARLRAALSAPPVPQDG